MAAQWTPTYPFFPPAKLEDGRKTLKSISPEKRYDSIGSAPAGVVGVGSTLIPGHFRLGRLDEAAGVCGGRVELWVLNWVPDFG
jgi:hypothetical protein